MAGSDPKGHPVRGTDNETHSLVTRLQARDPTALDELYQRVQARAFALARRVVGDAALAEDAVQEAFTQLWERADRISPGGGRIESLIMTMVHRRAVDLARRRGGRETTLPDPELLQPIDERASAMLEQAEDALTSEGLRSRLNAALSALPPEQRTVIKHAYFGEMSLREIAEREGVALGTVKSRLRLAMVKLTESIGEKASK
jgi:RNA polymerase sigma-70 factor (ECF subfamily)